MHGSPRHGETRADIPVTFYHPKSDGWRGSSELSRNRTKFAWAVQENWVVQTYLYLRDAGYPVQLSETLPSEGIVVLSPGCRFALRRHFDPFRHDDLIFVSARGDLMPLYLADFEVVQNGYYADGRRTFFVPHWPQPGLHGRDAQRGTRMRTAAYIGSPVNLDPAFRSSIWNEFLSGLGIAWRLVTDRERLGDYEDIDLIVAVRSCRKRSRFRNKPASKLVNAWAAGVPAIVGPEYAFKELRRSRLDFVEVTSLREAMHAVKVLFDDPAAYQAMVENGRRRYSAFRPERILERWSELLFDIIPAQVSGRRFSIRRGVPLRVRSTFAFAARPNFGGYPPRMLLGKAYRNALKLAQNRSS